jgi:hypothetical protein
VGDKGEREIQTQALVVKAALETADRQAAGATDMKLDNAIKGARDAGIKKKAASLNKEVSSNSGCLTTAP